MATALRDFQLTGSAFLAGRQFALLSDDAGLGKSAQVLHAADILGLKRILIIGPACAGASWPIQVKTWSQRRYTDIETARNFGFGPAGVYFVSFDMISMKANRTLCVSLCTTDRWDLIVIDEGQYLRSIGSNRTTNIYGEDAKMDFHCIAANAARIWVLSGTLTPNHAGEVYTHLRALFPSVLAELFGGVVPDIQTFEDRFCVVRNTTYGRVIEGSTNQKELRGAFAPHILRRLKKDVLGELPPMEWLEAPIKADAKSIEHLYAEMLTELGAPLDALTDEEAADFINGFPAYATKRRVLGLAKVRGCAEWVADRLGAGEKKIIIFAVHTDVIDGLNGYFADCAVTFDGRTSPADRAENVRRFQEDPRIQVFIGQIVAAGTAITLTAAKTVLFAEYSGTPGVNYQAASRAHRMGQHDGVQAYFATVPNTLDAKIARTAASRARDIAELFD
jgi:SWI/SNF-related matrix-associated actin-dependent regulator 1 of chromatin subfamily A